MIHFLFFVEPSSQEVDAVYCISPFGITVRHNSDWHYTALETSNILNRQESTIYELDWGKVPVLEEAVDEFDPEALVLFDQGGLTEDVLKNYANPIYSGTGQKDYESALLPLYVGDIRKALFDSYGWTPSSRPSDHENDEDAK